MAELSPVFNSVPRGISGTGAAVVYDQNIAGKPLSIFQNAQRYNLAAERVAAQRLAEEEKARAAQRKELALNANKTSAVYQEDITKKGRQYMDEYAAELKKYKGKLPYDRELDYKRRQQELLEQANYGQEVVKMVDDHKKTLLADKELNPDFVAEFSANVYFNPDGTPKYSNDFMLNNLPSEIRKNVSAYNEAEIAKNLEASYNSEKQTKFSRGGAFDITTVREANLPYKFDANGNVIKNPKTGRPQIFVNDDFLAYVDQNPNARGLIDAKMAQDEANGIDRPREEYVAELMQPRLSVNETSSRSRIPQPKQVAPLKNDTPAYSVQENLSGGTTTFGKPDSGKSETSTRYERLTHSIGKDKGGNYEVETSPTTIIRTNAETGQTEVVNNYTGNVKLVANGLTYRLVSRKTNNVLMPPANLEKTPAAYERWMEQQVVKPEYKDYVFKPLIRGVVTDEFSRASDFDQDKVAGAKSQEGSTSVAAKYGLDNIGGASKEVEVRKSKNAVFIPFEGQAAADAIAQTQGRINPTDNMVAIANRINDRIRRARDGAKSSQPVNSNVANPSGKKLYDTTPKSAPQQTANRVNSGGKKLY